MEEKSCCENCVYSVDTGDSVEYIWCEYAPKKQSVKKVECCLVHRHFIDGFMEVKECE